MKLKKNCKNPECKKEIKRYKSAKKKYCNETCKNRAHYLKRLKDDAYLIIMDKAMRKNYKTLNHLKKLGLGTVLNQTLVSHGFNFDAIHKAEIVIDENGKKIQAYHVYDIYFQKTDNGILIL